MVYINIIINIPGCSQIYSKYFIIIFPDSNPVIIQWLRTIEPGGGKAHPKLTILLKSASFQTVYHEITIIFNNVKSFLLVYSEGLNI